MLKPSRKGLALVRALQTHYGVRDDPKAREAKRHQVWPVGTWQRVISNAEVIKPGEGVIQKLLYGKGVR